MQVAMAHSAHQIEHRDAVLEGLRRLGNPDLPPTVMCWGWRAGRQYHTKGRDVLVLERGYIGDRFAYTSVALNGLNNLAEFPTARDDGGARFRSMGGKISEREDYGDHVLLVGQVHGDMSLRGKDLSPWYAQTARNAERAYGLPVLFRPHPQEVRRGIKRKVHGCQADMGRLADSLKNARVVVTYNSNTAVDSLLSGRDTVVSDSGSMAYPVSSHRLGDSASIDIQKWAYDLAWKQWSLDEIRSGEALVGIVEILRGR